MNEKEEKGVIKSQKKRQEKRTSHEKMEHLQKDCQEYNISAEYMTLIQDE